VQCTEVGKTYLRMVKDTETEGELGRTAVSRNSENVARVNIISR